MTFAADDPHGFTAYSQWHLIALAVLAVSLGALYLWRVPLRIGRRSRLGRCTLAAILIVCELSLNVWYIDQGVFRLRDTLPLELCSISLYLCVVMLLARSLFVFRIVYFTGIGGAAQALLTPVLGYDFPHYRFVEFFAAHIAIVLAVLYMAWVERFRPTLRSVGGAMLFLNVILLPVLAVNRLTGGNYMFLSRKPETASLLDVLGPYPWYLVSLEIAALLLFLLLYLPFAFKDRAGRRGMSSSHYSGG